MVSVRAYLGKEMVSLFLLRVPALRLSLSGKNNIVSTFMLLISTVIILYSINVIDLYPINHRSMEITISLVSKIAFEKNVDKFAQKHIQIRCGSLRITQQIFTYDTIDHMIDT